MGLLDRLGIRAVLRWLKYRKVDHFELRWRPPNGRGWRRVDDPDEVFDPSDLERPLPLSHFETHAEAMGYYQGEYRLVPINDRGQMEKSVWQTWFWEGPSLEAEKREEERKRQRNMEMLENLEQILDEVKRQRLEG